MGCCDLFSCKFLQTTFDLFIYYYYFFLNVCVPYVLTYLPCLLDGKFGAFMKLHIQNDGPVTIELTSPPVSSDLRQVPNVESYTRNIFHRSKHRTLDKQVSCHIHHFFTPPLEPLGRGGDRHVFVFFL